MAHTKAKGTTKLGRDSESKRLGVKIFGGSQVKCGQIIIRQRGTIYMPGIGVKKGKDDTLFAVKDGIVNFKKIKYTSFSGNKKPKQIVSVIPGTEIPGKKTGVADLKRIENKIEERKGIVQKVSFEEIKDAAQSRTKREIIREEELPMIPVRKDIRKAKSPVKHSHKK